MTTRTPDTADTLLACPWCDNRVTLLPSGHFHVAHADWCPIAAYDVIATNPTAWNRRGAVPAPADAPIDLMAVLKHSLNADLLKALWEGAEALDYVDSAEAKRLAGSLRSAAAQLRAALSSAPAAPEACSVCGGETVTEHQRDCPARSAPVAPETQKGEPT